MSDSSADLLKDNIQVNSPTHLLNHTALSLLFQRVKWINAFFASG